MIRFGLEQPHQSFAESHARVYEAYKRVCLECERLGFDSFWVNDHLMQHRMFLLGPAEPHLECWTTLAALAEATESITLGTLVTAVPFRNPAIVAKMGANVDAISNGRFILGLGAGWYEDEFQAYGIPFERPAVRLRRLREGIETIERMWTEETATYEGRYYRIKDAYCNPRPVQKPRPQIWVGGGGEKVTLRIVAERADATILSGSYSPEEIRHKLRVLRKHCEAAGRDFDDILKVKHNCFTIIAETEPELKEQITETRATEILTKDQLKNSFIGTPDQCIQRIEEFIDAGITYFILTTYGSKELETLKQFSEQVIPHFKSTE